MMTMIVMMEVVAVVLVIISTTTTYVIAVDIHCSFVTNSNIIKSITFLQNSFVYSDRLILNMKLDSMQTRTKEVMFRLKKDYTNQYLNNWRIFKSFSMSQGN